MYEIVIDFKPPFINFTYSRSGCQHKCSSCLKTAWCSGCDCTSHVTNLWPESHSLGSTLTPLIDTWTVCVKMICTESDVTVVLIHLPVNSCFWGKVIKRLLSTIMKHELIYWVNLNKLFLEDNQPVSPVLFIYVS